MRTPRRQSLPAPPQWPLPSFHSIFPEEFTAAALKHRKIRGSQDQSSRNFVENRCGSAPRLISLPGCCDPQQPGLCLLVTWIALSSFPVVPGPTQEVLAPSCSGVCPSPTLCLEGKQMGVLVQARILHFFFLSCPYPVSLGGRLATCCHPVIPEVLRAERQAWLHWWLGGGCVKGRAELPSHLDSEPWLLDKGSELLLGL